MLVTDQVAGQIVEFDGAGVQVGTIAIPEGPVGVAEHPDGRVFVSRMDGQVGIYDASFAQIGALDPAPLTMAGPNDLAISPTTGNIYVVDSAGHQVMEFDSAAGTLVRAWGSEGSGMAQFRSPQAIAVSAAGDLIYVADTDNYRVQVFSADGTFQFKFGYKTLYVGMSQTAWFARSEGPCPRRMRQHLPVRCPDGHGSCIRRGWPRGGFLVHSGRRIRHRGGRAADRR